MTVACAAAINQQTCRYESYAHLVPQHGDFER
jgi:hypothetical protein